MGVAWVADDAGRAVVPEPGWTETLSPVAGSGPRHRRPTLLSRGGQAVACRITSLARTDPGIGHPGHPRPQRRPALAARRYWV
jgi:hypothetical protein